MTEHSAAGLVGVAVPTLLELRAAVVSSISPDDAVTALREAGFAGGGAVYSAYEEWLAESGSVEPQSGRVDAGELSLDEFGATTSRFFFDAGWGKVTFSRDEEEGVAIVDVEDCWEGAAAGASAPHGCHITTGLLAAFFGRIAGYPVAVLETECCGGDGTRCRFLMGNEAVMTALWERNNP
jgi:predicted hydrocarbon binding protein